MSKHAQGGGMAWLDIANVLCGVDGNGFFCDATPAQKAAYEIRAKAVVEYFASLPPQVQGDVVVQRRVEGGWKSYTVDGAFLRDTSAQVAQPSAVTTYPLAVLVAEYARDLRRNSCGGDGDYPWEWAKATADYLETLIGRAAKPLSAELADALKRADEQTELANKSIRRLAEKTEPGEIGAFASRDHWKAKCDAAEARLAEANDGRDLTEGGLQLILMALKADDPRHEIIWRVEEELRKLRADRKRVGCLPIEGSK